MFGQNLCVARFGRLEEEKGTKSSNDNNLHSWDPTPSKCIQFFLTSLDHIKYIHCTYNRKNELFKRKKKKKKSLFLKYVLIVSILFSSVTVVCYWLKFQQFSIQKTNILKICFNNFYLVLYLCTLIKSVQFYLFI